MAIPRLPVVLRSATFLRARPPRFKIYLTRALSSLARPTWINLVRGWPATAVRTVFAKTFSTQLTFPADPARDQQWRWRGVWSALRSALIQLGPGAFRRAVPTSSG